MAVVVDTNVLIRYVTNDDPVKAERARLFIELVEQGSVECILCESVIAETIWVLTHPRTYNLSRDEVIEYMMSIIQLDAVRIQSKTLYLRALEMYKTSELDFTDCVLAAMVESGKASSLATFDAGIAEHFPIAIRQL